MAELAPHDEAAAIMARMDRRRADATAAPPVVNETDTPPAMLVAGGVFAGVLLAYFLGRSFGWGRAAPDTPASPLAGSVDPEALARLYRAAGK